MENTMYLSSLMQGLVDKQRLALYTGVTRAIRMNELTGLKLADQISIVTPKGARNVRDYMVMADLDAEQIIQLYVAAPVPGIYTRAQAEAMSPNNCWQQSFSRASAAAGARTRLPSMTPLLVWQISPIVGSSQD